MKKKVELELAGFSVTGTARLVLWGGELGEIAMERVYIPKEALSKDNILRAVNDNGFGCQAITGADIVVHRVYHGGYEEYDRTFYTDHPAHAKLFNGWRELNAAMRKAKEII